MAGEHGSGGGESLRDWAERTTREGVPVTIRHPAVQDGEYCGTCGQAWCVVHPEYCPGAPKIVADAAGARRTYREWFGRVNAEILSISGVGVDDLPDWGYWESWARGDVPASAAREALECASFPFDD